MTHTCSVYTFAITAFIYMKLVNIVEYNANADLRKKTFSVLESLSPWEDSGRSTNSGTQRTVRGI